MSRIRRMLSSLTGRVQEPVPTDSINAAGPQSYSQWCELMDRIVDNPRDEVYIETIRQGSVSWTSGVAERFVQSAADMIRKRINHAVDIYQRQMSTCRGNDIEISRALSGLTKEYRYLYQITQALPIPEKYVGELTELVQSSADQTYNSLIDSAKFDRSGKISSIIRGAGINKLSVRS